MKTIIPVILCGGSGTRLWPLSRQKTPKQFLRLLDERTLLQKTALRALDVLGAHGKDLVTITLEDMADETTRQLEELSPDMTRHVLREPEARNTAAAVAYAIRYVNDQFGPDSYLWILPADHHIGDELELKNALRKARVAADEGFLVTFGITPTRPETGYGYIQKAKSLNGSGTHFVKEFHEKPQISVAEKFVASGEYLWSSGMHLFNAQTGIRQFQEHAPDTWDSICQATAKAHCWASPDRRLYTQACKEPFETAVMEKARNVAVVPCDPQWSDIGSWESLWEINNKDGNGNACKGNVMCEDTENSMIMAQDKLVTCVGVKDIIVIETGDSVLVANKSCGNSLKNLVDMLRKENRSETVTHLLEDAGWGLCRTIFESPNTMIRECNVREGKTYKNAANAGLSQWIVADGEAVFLMDGHARSAGKDEILTIKPYTGFEIINKGSEELKLYEIRYHDAAKKDSDLSLRQVLDHMPHQQILLQGKAL